MKIKLIDLAREREAIGAEIDEAIACVLDSGRFIKGPEMRQFEQEFAAFCGAAECIAVGNGTDALEIALAVLGLGFSQVIVPTLTFVATAEAVVNAGSELLFADVGLDGQLLPSEAMRLARETRTDAMILVHLWGRPGDVEALSALADQAQLSLIEDCAQAHGLKIKGKHVGLSGLLGCFSFYPGKNLGAYGDAGALITNDEFLALEAKALRDHGRALTQKYEHSSIGRNSRMDEIQAAILRVKLRYLPQWNDRRREIADRYTDGLAYLGIVNDEPIDSVYHQFIIEIPGRDGAHQLPHRDQMRLFLANVGIETGVHYPVPLHLQPAFFYLGYREGDFPNAERLAKQVLSLPMHPFLRDDEIDYVVEQVRAGYGLKEVP